MKRCKNCGSVFGPRYNTLEKYCWDADCKTIEAMEKLEKIKKEKKKIQRVKDNVTRKSLIKYSDQVKLTQMVFNKYIRMRDEGQLCISCKKIPKKKNAGHFWNANNHWNVRFDERNVHLQCEHCNNHLSGNLLNYQENLIKKIGIEEYNNLASIRQEVRKYSKIELEEIMNKYNNEIKKLKNGSKSN